MSVLLTLPIGWTGDIEVTDHGDSAPDSGGGTATHTYNTKTSTGPVSLVLITWRKSSTTNTSLTGITWNGVAMSILVQVQGDDTVSETVGAGVCLIAGAQSGNIVASFNQTCDSEITIVSLANVRTLTPSDTDFAGAAGGASLSALASPSAGGIRIVAVAGFTDTSGYTWTPADVVELSDIDAGTWRHACAYQIGDDATAFEAATGGAGTNMAGASLR
jgi:hypothetical protein